MVKNNLFANIFSWKRQNSIAIREHLIIVGFVEFKNRSFIYFQTFLNILAILSPTFNKMPLTINAKVINSKLSMEMYLKTRGMRKIYKFFFTFKIFQFSHETILEFL